MSDIYRQHSRATRMDDPVAGEMDGSVVTFANDEVSAVHDDVLEGSDVFPKFVGTHSHASIRPDEGNQMHADPVAISKRGGRQ